MARKSKLTSADIAYAWRCERIVRKVQSKLGRAAVAHKLGISMSALSKYLSGACITEERRATLRKEYRPVNHRARPIGYRGTVEHKLPPALMARMNSNRY